MRFLIVFLFLVFSCGGGGGGKPSTEGQPSSGEGFHVSVNGDDANPGTLSQPWRTIQHAAQNVSPGDVVYVHPGNYDEDVTLTLSGNPGSPIVFRVYGGTGSTSIKSNGGVVVRSFTIAQGVSHVRLEGFTVRGYSVWGITVLGDNSHIELSNLDVSGGESGIHFTAGNSGEDPLYGPVSNVTLENSRIYDTQFTAVDCTPGPCNYMTFRNLEIYGAGLVGGASFGADGLAVERGHHITVENCYIHDNGGDGIDLNSRDREGNVEGIVVTGNRVERNHLNGIKMWAGGYAEGNAIWGQGLNPLLLCVFDCSAEVSYNTVAYNMWDPSYSARDYASTFGYPEPGSGGPAVPQVNLRLHHNIFAFNTGPSVGEPSGIYMGPGVNLLEEHDNLFYSRQDEEIFAAFLNDRSVSRQDIQNGTWASLTGHGQNDLTVDPQFISGWPDVDLHLSPGSPAEGLGAYP